MKRIVIFAMILASAIASAAHVYNNFLEAGKYALADKNYELSEYFNMEALRQIPADSVVDRYIAHSRLRNMNNLRGTFDKALSHGRECLNIIRGFGPGNQAMLMEDYIMLAVIHAGMKDSLMASHYVDSARQQVSDPATNPACLKKFATMAGIVYTRIGDWQRAETAYREATELARRYKPSEDTSTTLNLYGNVLFHNDKYADALGVYEEQRGICRDLFGEDSMQFQWANYCIANMRAYMGDIAGGVGIYEGVIRWYRDRIVSDLKTMPESNRQAYLDNMIDILQNAVPFGIEAKHNEDEFTRIAYENLLFTKGLLLASEKSADAIIRRSGNAEERAALDSVKAMRGRLTELLATTGASPVDIINLYAGIKGIDVNLANACEAYGNHMSFAAVGYEAVRESLKDDEVLLDFADFKPKSRPRQYVCYVIRRNQNNPQVHYICNGSELDSLLALENHRWSNLYSGEAAEDMARIIGRPLKKIIGGSRRVYYVPSGIFHKLSVEAIPEGEGMMCDSFEFKRLSSAREIVNESDESLGMKARLYGGLDYDSDVVLPNASSAAAGRIRLSLLPRSREEVTEISRMMNNPVLLTADRGTEESFMEMNGNAPSVIHVATHGFYYSPEDADRPASLQGYNDAMSLSGLVMSGGNAGWLGLIPSKGLLTAEKVSRCDLSGAGIVCLASCHSGQGEVTSEGIYGLQRAFKKAGAQTLILSLWEASDNATKCFMTNFYSDLINGSKNRHRAFEFAREQVRRQYPSPVYWAGFIMVD